MQLTAAEWALIASFIFNIVSVIGWVYNHTQAAKLAKELETTHRGHEKADRDLADFRKRLANVADLASALNDQHNNFIHMSLLCKPDDFSNADYEALYASIIDEWSKIDTLQHHPEYLSALHYLPSRLRHALAEQFANLHKVHVEFTECAGNTASQEGLATMARAAYEVAIHCGALSKIVSLTFSWVDEDLAKVDSIGQSA